MHHIKLSYILLFMLSLFSIKAQELKNDVLICYGNFLPEKVTGYNYVIIEASHFNANEIKTLKQNNTHVLAYISLGEVNQYATYFKEIEPYVLEKNPVWNSYVINIKNGQTRAILKNTITTIFELGVDGFFLDNIDNYTSFGATPQLKADLISFLDSLKQDYPDLVLIQNAGLSVLKDTNHLVDAVAVESIFTDYQFDTKTYRLRAKKDADYKMNIINSIRKTIDIPFIFIEYSNSKNLTKKVKKLIPNKHNTSCFFSLINLQKLPNSND